eukprot:scaffold34689_cov289-Amphora_coffeaeformis.AAC.1
MPPRTVGRMMMMMILVVGACVYNRPHPTSWNGGPERKRPLLDLVGPRQQRRLSWLLYTLTDMRWSSFW